MSLELLIIFVVKLNNSYVISFITTVLICLDLNIVPVCLTQVVGRHDNLMAVLCALPLNVGAAPANARVVDEEVDLLEVLAHLQLLICDWQSFSKCWQG